MMNENNVASDGTNERTTFKQMQSIHIEAYNAKNVEVSVQDNMVVVHVDGVLVVKAMNTKRKIVSILRQV